MKTNREYILRQQKELYNVYISAYAKAINNGLTQEQSVRNGVYAQTKYLRQVGKLEENLGETKQWIN